MQPPLTTREIRHTNFLTRLTLILFGVFLTSLIFAIAVKIMEETGIWIGLIICLAAAGSILYYRKPGSSLRIIAWSMLCMVVFCLIIYFVGLNYLAKTFEGFQK